MDVELKQRHYQASNALNDSDVTAKENVLKKMDSNMCQYITILGKSENVNKRLLIINQLLKYLKHNKHKEKLEREVLYCLKRLIRGCGAANNNSRSSFYVALVALLKSYDDGKYIKLSDCFTLLDKELQVGNKLNNKEDADAVIGHILVCGAILRSGFVFKNTMGKKNDSLERLVQLLVKSTKYRLYHGGMAYQLLCELLEHLTEQQFITVVWPHLQTLLDQPWCKRTSYSVYCLLKVQEKYRQISKQYIRCHYDGSGVFNKESYPYLYKIFWHHSNMDILIQPALHEFGKYLANSAHLYEFWFKEIDKGLEKPVKLTGLITLKILTGVLENIDIQQKQLRISKLLSDNFMIALVNGLKNLKQTQKDYDIIYAFYYDFLQALVEYCQKFDDDSEKVEIIKRLILPPQSTLGIEKLCHQRIIHQLVNTLQEDGIQNIFELYKSIFMAERIKDVNNPGEKWLHFERMNAGYMLQHLLQNKAIQSSYKWREKQLKFLFICGTVYITDKGVPCQKNISGEFSKDFGDQCKNMFYNCLQGKIYNLEKEYKLLWNLFIYCHNVILRGLKTNNFSGNDKIVHFKIKYATLKKIQVIYTNIKELLCSQNASIKENQENIVYDDHVYKCDGVMIVFRILITYMSLQAFRESEIAIPAILDLISCMERLYSKSNNSNNIDRDEPEWIEVVIDLFLHLLSQSNNCLRTVINALFPHMCSNLSLTAIHQILNVLNMKNDYNPLVAKTESDIENEEKEEHEDENYYSNMEEENDNKSVADTYYYGDVDCNENSHSGDNGADNDDDDGNNNNDDDGNNNDDNINNNDDDYNGNNDDDKDEDLTVASDKLRNAVSQALIENGAAVFKISRNGVGDNNGHTDDSDNDDMTSIDLNDLTEEQGKQLDEALSKAFQAMRKNVYDEKQGLKKNKTKSQRIQSTALMHFRLRVLDLLDTYVQSKPTLLIIVEIMQHLYEMLSHCIVGNLFRNENLKPLQQRIEKLLQKITIMKDYPNHQEAFTENDCINFIRLILEQKSKSTFLCNARNKCIIFLIMNSPPFYTIEQLENAPVIILLKEYLHEFVKSRNPTINITLVRDIFKLRWLGVWPLANYMCSSSQLCWQTRIYRRVQIYEILIILYKNCELHKMNDEMMRFYFKKLNTSLYHYFTILGSISLERKLNHSRKEFLTILELLMTINKTYKRMCMNYELTSKEVLHSLHGIRIGIHLSTLPAYIQFRQMFNLSPIEFGNKCSYVFTEGDETEKDKIDNSKHPETMDYGILSNKNKRKERKVEKEMQQRKKLKS